MQGKRWPFTRAIVEHAPEDSGVLLLWQGDELIYVASAARDQGGIRKALLGLLDAKDGTCTSAATFYSWEITFAAASRAAELIASHGKSSKRLPRCNAEG